MVYLESRRRLVVYSNTSSLLKQALERNPSFESRPGHILTITFFSIRHRACKPFPELLICFFPAMTAARPAPSRAAKPKRPNALSNYAARAGDRNLSNKQYAHGSL